MFPRLIDLGRVPEGIPLLGGTELFLPSYGVLFALGTIAGWWWFIHRGRSLGLPDEPLFNLSFYTLLGGILGAKLLLVILDWRDYVTDPSLLWGTLRSAGVLLGGIIAGALVFVIYARRQGLPLFRLGDAIAAPLALAQAIGRLGCFSAGCCWGAAAGPHAPFSVTFTSRIAHDQTGVPLHEALVPTQLYQFGADLALAALLAWMWRRRIEPSGTVFWVYVVLYSIGRGLIEFWRGDVQRGLYFDGAVSTSQLLSIGGLILGLAMLAYGRLRGRQPHEAHS